MEMASQLAANPTLLHRVTEIAERMTTCLILHNMLVSDRIRGDPTKIYDPAASFDMEIVTAEQPPDLLDVQQRLNTNYQPIHATTNNQMT
jgi:hypothetical protein